MRSAGCVYVCMCLRLALNYIIIARRIWLVLLFWCYVYFIFALFLLRAIFISALDWLLGACLFCRLNEKMSLTEWKAFLPNGSRVLCLGLKFWIDNECSTVPSVSYANLCARSGHINRITSVQEAIFYFCWWLFIRILFDSVFTFRLVLWNEDFHFSRSEFDIFRIENRFSRFSLLSFCVCLRIHYCEYHAPFTLYTTNIYSYWLCPLSCYLEVNVRPELSQFS